ncbi:hypothetical protein BGZ83_000906 [Gryganskiella cystojenkinii]|nr:hypothetical protein BGZ83_000906 [Gryganskiella cystojenkinii]
MKVLLSAVAAMAMLLATSADNLQQQQQQQQQQVISVAKGDPPAGDYSVDYGGPVHWRTCDKGTHLSPINIDSESPDTFVTCNKTPLLFDYQPINDVRVHWNGRMVEFDWARFQKGAHTNTIVYHTKVYELTEIHFHTPSEHRINNRHADAELHLVHQNQDDGSLAIVAVLLHVQYLDVPVFNSVVELAKKINQAFNPDGDEADDSENVDQLGKINDNKNSVPKTEADEVDHKQDEDEDEDEDEEEEDEEDEADIVDQNETDEPIEDAGDSPDFESKVETNIEAQVKAPHDDIVCTGKLVTLDDAKTIDLTIPTVDLSPILRSIGKFSPRWEYEGSLTTPPCSENVSWLIMHNTYPISIVQLKALVDIQGYNARPIQEVKPGPNKYLPNF